MIRQTLFMAQNGRVKVVMRKVSGGPVTRDKAPVAPARSRGALGNPLYTALVGQGALGSLLCTPRGGKSAPGSTALVGRTAAIQNDRPGKQPSKSPPREQA